MGKAVKYLLQICIFIPFLFSNETYSLGSQYEFMCTGMKLTLIERDCVDNVKQVSKCQLDSFKKNICETWGGPNNGPVYPVQIRRNYSDVNTRIVLPTEVMNKKIYRYWEEHEVISYAWEQWKDLDFILMIQEESLWEEFIFGDNGTSIGYCQISSIYGKELYEKYLNAKNWKERITICHDHYINFAYNVGIVFHGWKTRMRNLPSFTFR